ncbi:LAMI_0E07514g1_1 [Lachancea mirantina]|uniref:LAMI_0E07514g1_1 n=1 Tax=Lachancea mirantina TaxID=1230905 RepID=A0A1G4JMH2_9SACH|nr:LAMI_0E07514g1_1 [Lachancea mirantina]
MYLVDVEVNKPVLAIIKRVSREIGHQYGGKARSAVSNVVAKAVEDKIRYSAAGDRPIGTSFELSSRDLALVGHGSLDIGTSLTEAQENIIKNLTRVMLHQVYETGTYAISEGQRNMLLSLCVKHIHVETRRAQSSKRMRVEDTEGFVSQIRSSLQSEQQERNTSFLKKDSAFQVRFYACLDKKRSKEPAAAIAEEFDKIDLHSSERAPEDDEDDHTLLPSSDAIASLPFSPQMLAQVEVHLLPCTEFEGMWESLQFDDDLKSRLFGYATIALKLANFAKGHQSTAIGNNKLLFVHGPPGTGKTTVCKALCQKLAIRHGRSGKKIFFEDEPRVVLVEMSCSRLFSRWYGESAKNLDGIFENIERLLLDQGNKNKIVCLLIDEVETIASSRISLMGKNETTDGIRVVNALLTKLDQMKKYNNFLTLATSNLIESLDPAFLDRADGMFFVDSPSFNAASVILNSCIEHLVKINVVTTVRGSNILENQKFRKAIDLIAERCAESKISGRTLRKLPIVCLSESTMALPITIEDFLMALASTTSMKARQVHVAVCNK